MNSAATITLENDRLLVTGDLDFTSVVSLWNTSLSLLQNCKDLNFDFSRVTSSNSAGLALLVEWVKLANKQHKKIHFHNIPPQLISIAAVGGVGHILNNHS